MPPPQGLSRGKSLLSRISVDMPASPSVFAAVAPAGPAPTTMTSKSVRIASRLAKREEHPQSRKGALDEIDAGLRGRIGASIIHRRHNPYQCRICPVVVKRVPGDKGGSFVLARHNAVSRLIPIE